MNKEKEASLWASQVTQASTMLSTPSSPPIQYVDWVWLSIQKTAVVHCNICTVRCTHSVKGDAYKYPFKRLDQCMRVVYIVVFECVGGRSSLQATYDVNN